jgi:predicted  nucleic acid-binding Zn-ribbon protein
MREIRISRSKTMKTIDAKVSAKYNIGYYSNNGVYIHSESGERLKIFNGKKTIKENWNDAVEWAKKNMNKIKEEDLYVVTAFDKTKGRRSHITVPQSKEKTESVLKKLKREQKVAIPKYKNLSAFKMELAESSTYSTIHSLPKVVKIHEKKIKARGGEILSKKKVKGGTELKYKFK